MFTTLQITLFVSFIILIATFIYLLTRPKKKKQLQSTVNDQDQDNPAWVSLVIIGVLIIVILGIYFTFKRYDVAYQSIKSGHPGVAVAALSPEIGEGVADVIQSFNNSF